MVRWTIGEVLLLRATGFIHVSVSLWGFVSPADLFGAWGLPVGEPGVFRRIFLAVLALSGLALLRIARGSRPHGAPLVQTVALAKLLVFGVVLMDALVRKLPAHAPIGAVLDLGLGAALLRVARRAGRDDEERARRAGGA